MVKLVEALELMGDVLDDTIIKVRYVSEPMTMCRIMPVRDVKRIFRRSIPVDGVRFCDDGWREYILRG